MPEVRGFHPDTGEEITIVFTGNFPLKDPETGVFVMEKESGKPDGPSVPVFPGRERKRFTMLNANREEIIDTRPMAAAVMFSDHIPPEEKIKDMMRDANFRAQLRAYLAEEEGVDTYDDFDYDDDLLLETGVVDGFASPDEVVKDSDTGRSVPRALLDAFKGMKDAVKEAAKKGTGPLGTNPPPDTKVAPEAAPVGKPEPSTPPV
jgi:hypothetical protein